MKPHDSSDGRVSDGRLVREALTALRVIPSRSYLAQRVGLIPILVH